MRATRLLSFAPSFAPSFALSFAAARQCHSTGKQPILQLARRLARFRQPAARQSGAKVTNQRNTNDDDDDVTLASERVNQATAAIWRAQQNTLAQRNQTQRTSALTSRARKNKPSCCVIIMGLSRARVFLSFLFNLTAVASCSLIINRDTEQPAWRLYEQANERLKGWLMAYDGGGGELRASARWIASRHEYAALIELGSLAHYVKWISFPCDAAAEMRTRIRTETGTGSGTGIRMNRPLASR